MLPVDMAFSKTVTRLVSEIGTTISSSALSVSAQHFPEPSLLPRLPRLSPQIRIFLPIPPYPLCQPECNNVLKGKQKLLLIWPFKQLE